MLAVKNVIHREKTSNLQLTLQPSAGGNCWYDLSIQNVGQSLLTEILIDYASLLHPGQFGLDDTHMPKDIWIKDAIALDYLAPGEVVTAIVEGYNTPDRYDGWILRLVAVDMKIGSDEADLCKNYLAHVNVILPNARKNTFCY